MLTCASDLQGWKKGEMSARETTGRRASLQAHPDALRPCADVLDIVRDVAHVAAVVRRGNLVAVSAAVCVVALQQEHKICV